MRTVIRVGALATVLVCGCFDAGDESEGGGGVFGGPRSGQWVFSQGDLQDDMCMWEMPPDLGIGEMTIVNHEDGTFELILASNGQRIDCIHEGHDYVCDPTESQTPIPFVDAIVLATVTVQGRFTTNERIDDGTYDVDADCTGTQCDVAAMSAKISGFPCSYRVPYTAVFSN